MNAVIDNLLYDTIREIATDYATSTKAITDDATTAVQDHNAVVTRLINAGKLTDDSQASQDSRNFQDRLWRYTHDEHSTTDRRQLLLLLQADVEAATIPGEF